METEVLYYVCLNNHCPKHRNVFTEGDPEHERCARERLRLQGERRPMPRLLMAAAGAVAITILGLAIALIWRANRPQNPQLPMIREEAPLERQKEPAP